MSHTHGPGTYKITGAFAADNWRTPNCSGAFYQGEGIYPNDGWPSWHSSYMVHMEASAARGCWTGSTGESPAYTNSTGDGKVLKPENLKRHRVLAWIRIA
jgi:hypothetical protein